MKKMGMWLEGGRGWEEGLENVNRDAGLIIRTHRGRQISTRNREKCIR